MPSTPQVCTWCRQPVGLPCFCLQHAATITNSTGTWYSNIRPQRPPLGVEAPPPTGFLYNDPRSTSNPSMLGNADRHLNRLDATHNEVINGLAGSTNNTQTAPHYSTYLDISSDEDQQTQQTNRAPPRPPPKPPRDTYPQRAPPKAPNSASSVNVQQNDEESKNKRSSPSKRR